MSERCVHSLAGLNLISQDDLSEKKNKKKQPTKYVPNLNMIESP